MTNKRFAPPDCWARGLVPWHTGPRVPRTHEGSARPVSCWATRLLPQHARTRRSHSLLTPSAPTETPQQRASTRLAPTPPPTPSTTRLSCSQKDQAQYGHDRRTEGGTVN